MLAVGLATLTLLWTSLLFQSSQPFFKMSTRCRVAHSAGMSGQAARGPEPNADRSNPPALKPSSMKPRDLRSDRES